VEHVHESRYASVEVLGVPKVYSVFGSAAGRKTVAGAIVVALVAALVLALAPGTSAAAVPSRFPAAGELLVPSVVVRKQPRPTAGRKMVLRELRSDLRPQIVHAIGMRRIGVVQELKARLVLANANGANALQLTAREAGAEGNSIRVAVRDVPANPDTPDAPAEDEFVVIINNYPMFPFRYAETNLADLAAKVNASAVPVSATVVANGVPLRPVQGAALAGGRTGNPGRVWYKLNLPIRPFGQTGWIPGETALLKPTTRRVVVRRGAKVLDVYQGSRRIFRARVAVGRPDRKTPLGNFYVAAKYVPPRNALVSTYALELSAPAGLPDFLQGGVVGIHGTPATYTLGKAASNGCIRVSPATARRLKRIVPLGSPVKVVR
jgi:lipoprotein-anchoring transpeptidase ErfK/SrfK